MIKIVSGGQTGVDRAALDVALQHGLTIGGWCPKNRKALDGPIPDKYPLQATKSSEYRIRTEWNIRDSDGTLILNTGKLTGGTRLTNKLAVEKNKPVFVVQLDETHKIPSAYFKIVYDKKGAAQAFLMEQTTTRDTHYCNKSVSLASINNKVSFELPKLEDSNVIASRLGC